jgi:general secretion pathway protein C
MQLLTFDTTDTAQTAGVAVLTMAATALLALTAAYWSWQWLAPPAAARAAPAPGLMRDATAAAGLFGAAQRDIAGTASASPDIRLLGIVAATPGKNGYAVLRIEPRQIVTVQEGKDIAAGIRLAAVRIDHVVLDRAGTLQTLSWPAKSQTTVAPLPRIGK